MQFLLSYGRPAQFRPKKVGAGLLHSLFLITMPFSPQVTLHVDHADQSPQLPSMSGNTLVFDEKETFDSKVTSQIHKIKKSLHNSKLKMFLKTIVVSLSVKCQSP